MADPLELGTYDLHTLLRVVVLEDKRLGRIKLRKGERLSERAMERAHLYNLHAKITAELERREG